MIDLLLHSSALNGFSSLIILLYCLTFKHFLFTLMNGHSPIKKNFPFSVYVFCLLNVEL